MKSISILFILLTVSSVSWGKDIYQANPKKDNSCVKVIVTNIEAIQKVLFSECKVSETSTCDVNCKTLGKSDGYTQNEIDKIKSGFPEEYSFVRRMFSKSIDSAVAGGKTGGKLGETLGNKVAPENMKSEFEKGGKILGTIFTGSYGLGLGLEKEGFDYITEDANPLDVPVIADRTVYLSNKHPMSVFIAELKTQLSSLK